MWKTVKDFEDYQVSDNGDAKSLKKGGERILKPQPSSNGYLTVCFWKEGKHYTKSVHRLVAEAFIPNPDNLRDVDHINGDRTDNRVENLRWCRHKDNTNYDICRQRMSEAHTGKKLSEQHRDNISKANKGKPKPHFEVKIDQYTLDDVFVRTWKSTMEIERTLGFKHNNISSACNGKLKTAYGSKWRYSKQ